MHKDMQIFLGTTELRQYLLAKLLWDTTIDIQATTNDFLRGFYGKAAPYISEYLDLLSKTNRNLILT
jgi:hypothetical protein